MAQAGMSGSLRMSMGQGLDGMGRSRSIRLLFPAQSLTPHEFPPGIAGGARIRPLL